MGSPPFLKTVLPLIVLFTVVIRAACTPPQCKRRIAGIEPHREHTPPPSLPSRDWPHLCSLLSPSDVNPTYGYAFNARSFCLTSAICLQPPASPRDAGTIWQHATRARTRCNAVNADLVVPRPRPINCSLVQRLVHCAHGAYPADASESPRCPTVARMAGIDARVMANATWIGGLVLVVPAYTLPTNIYHFSFEAMLIMHVASVLHRLLPEWYPHHQPRRVLRLTVLYRGRLPPHLGKWHADFMNVLLHRRMRHANVHIIASRILPSTHGPDGPALTCMRGAVLLGMRSHFFAWPFANARFRVPDNGSAVPAEALALRAVAYAEYGVATKLPPAIGDVNAMSSRVRMADLPPLGLAYARRNNQSDATPADPMQKGPTRRFSDRDELWFTAMLQDVAKDAGFSYDVVETPATMGLAEQVTMFARMGVVAGIHGANLVNAVFMPAFSALVEVSNKRFPCYRAGLNSGLASWLYKPVHLASAVESACVDFPCATIVNQRRVMVDRQEDRAELTAMIRMATAHVRRLHDAFSHLGGVPLLFDETSSEYSIDWSKRV